MILDARAGEIVLDKSLREVKYGRGEINQEVIFKMLFVIKPDIFCIPCKLRVCKFPKNSMDVNYMENDCMKVLSYYFMEICKPPVNEPIGSYQIHHLNT